MNNQINRCHQTKQNAISMMWSCTTTITGCTLSTESMHTAATSKLSFMDLSRSVPLMYGGAGQVVIYGSNKGLVVR